MEKKIHVLGWYNKNNIGDEAYKLAFPKLFPGNKFTFSDVDAPITSDVCIVGGGDIFNSVYVNKALKCQGKKFIISTGVNSLSPIEQIPHFEKVLVRDKNAYEKIKHFPNAGYMPDVALALQPNKKRGKEMMNKYFKSSNAELYGKKIGVVINAYLLPSVNSVTRDFINFYKIVNDLINVMDNTPASFVFFPMSTGMPFDDRISNGVVANQCKFWKKNLYLTHHLGVQDTLDLISACDIVISSRLHSTIFSMISGVPFLDLTHHDKNKRYIDSMGLGELSYSYWNFDSQSFKAKLNFMLENPSPYEDKVNLAYWKQKEALIKTSSSIVF